MDHDSGERSDSRNTMEGEHERRTLRVSLLLSMLLLPLELGLAQQTNCSACHFANPDAPGHLYEWDRSPHGQNNVGCEKCHGGDATTFESFRAHREILDSHNPASPVNRRNIPKTCGSCHSGPFVAFQDSKHYALLQEGNRDVPVCITCHSEVAGRLLSPNALAARCQKCHTDKGVGSHPEFPAQGRRMLETIREVRTLLDQAKPLIKRVRDREIRQRLEEQYRQVEVPLIEAVNFGHSFVFDASEDRGEVARRRAEVLLENLANPLRPQR